MTGLRVTEVPFVKYRTIEYSVFKDRRCIENSRKLSFRKLSLYIRAIEKGNFITIFSKVNRKVTNDIFWTENVPLYTNPWKSLKSYLKKKFIQNFFRKDRCKTESLEIILLFQSADEKRFCRWESVLIPKKMPQKNTPLLTSPWE